MMNRNDLIKYLQQEYICDVDYPWDKYPDYIIIRRRDNQKCESDLIPNLINEKGIYPAYHMNKRHWISVDIERYEDLEKLKMMVDMSYRLVGQK